MAGQSAGELGSHLAPDSLDWGGSQPATCMPVKPNYVLSSARMPARCNKAPGLKTGSGTRIRIVIVNTIVNYPKRGV